MSRHGGDELRAGIYIGSVAMAGAVAIAWSLVRVVRLGSGVQLMAWAGLAAVTVLAGSLSVRLPVRDCRVSFSDALLFMSIAPSSPWSRSRSSST